MLSLTKGAHSQSGKEVRKIKVLHKTFDYQDKRGYSMWTTIDGYFALEIVEQIPSLHYYPDRMAQDRDREYKLSWRDHGDDKGLQILLHCAGQHVYTSQVIKM